MAKNDRMKLPLKGSDLRPEIVTKLAVKSLSNPDAPSFKPQPEKMTLVRHLMWAVRTVQNQDKISDRRDINPFRLAEVFSLSREEAEQIIWFLQSATNNTFYIVY